MTEKILREFITGNILGRLSAAGAQREEALRDVLGLTVPNLDDTAAAGIAGMIPELPVLLYEKWAGLFVDRLLETVPQAQIADLCRGTDESNATLALVYVMFMESERMEKLVAEDLRAIGVPSGANETSDNDTAALVGAWLKRRMTATCQ